MQGMECIICKRKFWGRRNQLYCPAPSPCRRVAEGMAKQRKNEAARIAFFASLSPEEKAWRESLPSPSELWMGYDNVMKKNK